MTQPSVPEFDGHFVSLSGNRLVRMASSGEQYAHLLAADTHVTCDGVLCRPSDLQTGQRIRVIHKPLDPKFASRVEVLKSHDHFVR